MAARNYFSKYSGDVKFSPGLDLDLYQLIENPKSSLVFNYDGRVKKVKKKSAGNTNIKRLCYNCGRRVPKASFDDHLYICKARTFTPSASASSYTFEQKSVYRELDSASRCVTKQQAWAPSLNQSYRSVGILSRKLDSERQGMAQQNLHTRKTLLKKSESLPLVGSSSFELKNGKGSTYHTGLERQGKPLLTSSPESTRKAFPNPSSTSAAAVESHDHHRMPACPDCGSRVPQHAFDGHRKKCQVGAAYVNEGLVVLEDLAAWRLAPSWGIWDEGGGVSKQQQKEHAACYSDLPQDEEAREVGNSYSQPKPNGLSSQQEYRRKNAESHNVSLELSQNQEKGRRMVVSPITARAIAAQIKNGRVTTTPTSPIRSSPFYSNQK